MHPKVLPELDLEHALAAGHLRFRRIIRDAAAGRLGHRVVVQDPGFSFFVFALAHGRAETVSPSRLNEPARGSIARKLCKHPRWADELHYEPARKAIKANEIR